MGRSRVLDEGDRPLVEHLLARDPVANCFVASRLPLGLLDPTGTGELWGYPAHAPRALLHVGANIVPIGADDEALDVFARDLGGFRSFVAIVGLAPLALGLQRRLADRYGHPYESPRLERRRQFLMTRRSAPELPGDVRLRAVTEQDFEPYLDAAVAMYREELEEDPLRTNPTGYRRYVRSLVAAGRAFGIFEGRDLVFKADLGAMSPEVAQVQGVWVAPKRRGEGIAAPAMAAVTRVIVDQGRVASLYVNDFNTPAIATYRRCGYTVEGEFASVLY